MAVSDINSIIKDYSTQNDFGFSTTQKSVVEEQTVTIEEYKDRLKKIEELVMPLLANLHSTGKDDYIYWPNRTETLEKKIKEFLALTR
jgi:hypothetical protein